MVAAKPEMSLWVMLLKAISPQYEFTQKNIEEGKLEKRARVRVCVRFEKFEPTSSGSKTFAR